MSALSPTRNAAASVPYSNPTILSHLPLSEWGSILFNTTIATAIADRLVENSKTFLLGGERVPLSLFLSG